MNNNSSENKYRRLLSLYSRLVNGEVINKADEAEKFGVSLRSVQYDIDDLRAYFSDKQTLGEADKELVYDAKLNGYYLKSKSENVLSNGEVLAICKILLESRAFCKSDISVMLEKIISNCVPASSKSKVKELVSNELFHYIEPQHKQHFIEQLWEISNAVSEHRVLDIRYEKLDGEIVERKIQPVGIMFSEFYFYLTAFISDIDKEKEFDNPNDIFPTIYRIDRIRGYSVSNEHFYVPYRDRFEEGEFRKRIQFMYGGRLRRIKFLFKGVNPEAVLDRLPTAKIIERTKEGYLFSAEVFGDGIDMWLRSQGELIQLIK